ncbi:hypothetical protein BV20DRAFT_1123787 [Pilatotrama ljubarskyi]|nr:hypothetical protein BV20DRAFT_1123787 [Pilatotrama ljubarskyi]
MALGDEAATTLPATPEHDDIEILGVPGWLRKHPELRRRGILLTEFLKPTIVYRSFVDGGPSYVVKLVKPDSDEAYTYRLLQSDSDPRNHTIPCEIIECAQQQPILVMPYLTSFDHAGLPKWPLSRMLSTFLQVVEAVEYLHDHNIVHLDICNGNVLIATEYEARTDARLVAGRVYLIDFESSRQLSAGPGLQQAINVPPAQIKPPAGMDRVDPYAWDVYCLGKLFERMAKGVYWRRPGLPWAVTRMMQWIVGNEQGCADSHCRPTVRQTRRVLSVFLWATRAVEFSSAVAGRTVGLFKG